MGRRLMIFPVLLLGFAAAGPVIRHRRAHDGAHCSTECPGDAKFQYSEKVTYKYSYESSNTLKLEDNTEVLSGMKATVEITPVSKCDMMLEISEATVNHGSETDSSSTHTDNLKKHPLYFSWLDGKIADICADPEDTEDINNIKRGILSALQNSMKSLFHDSIERETDVLGSCDTEYKVKSFKGEKAKIYKTKNLASCSNHLKANVKGFTASAYESPASPFQHFPYLSGRSYDCHQLIDKGVIHEVNCEEKGDFMPLAEYASVVHLSGYLRMQLLSQEPGEPKEGVPTNRESLIYEYEPKKPIHQEAEANDAIRELCEKSNGLLATDVGTTVHKLVNIVRGLPPETVQSIYDSLKDKESCGSAKALAIFLDVLRTASSEGAVTVLTRLAVQHEIPEHEIMLWLASMPFVTYPDEGAIQAALSLLDKSFESKQALLSVPAMAYKYCYHHPDCENSPAVKSVISSLEEYLGGDCKVTSHHDEEQIMSALKGLGNLGFLGSAKDTVLKCASESSTTVPVRIAALEAFRRSPCSEEVSIKLMGIYENMSDLDEVRIAALRALSKCPSPQVIYRIAKAYEVEKIKQVEVFTWTYLKNLERTSDPLKQKARFAALQLHLKRPESINIMKFSRNIELSWFSEQLNLGYSLEGNLIHSHTSFLPRSGNIDLTVDFLGQQINLLEVGMRAEHLEHIMEELFGPKGYLQSNVVEHHTHETDPTIDATADTYSSRIQGLRDKVTLDHKDAPEGIYYIRILGNELRWRHVDSHLLKSIGNLDFNGIMEQLTKYKKIDSGHSLMFLDNKLLIPSLTGRAYKFASNGSGTLGLKSEGSFSFEGGSKIRDMEFSLDRRYQPSGAIQVDISFGIYSEDYEPGIRTSTSASFGQDIKVQLDLKKGPSIEAKWNFPTEQNEILSFKREVYMSDMNGERVLKHPENHNFNFCTKYLEKFTGIRLCGEMNYPHLRDDHGKLKIPTLSPLDAKIVMTKTDKAMTGYEFTFKLPESFDSPTQEYKLAFDTPNSEINRKFSTEYVITHPDSETRTGKLRFYSPYYTLDADTRCKRRPDRFELDVEVLGDGRRKYTAKLDVDIDVKGVRLAAYKPTFTFTLPNKDPVHFYGKVVIYKGKTDTVNVDISSDNVGNHPFMLSGTVSTEGRAWSLDSAYTVTSNLTIKALSKTHHSYGTYKRVATDVSAEMGFDYTPEGKSLQSVKLKAALSKLSMSNPLSFTWTSEMLMSEFPQFNTRVIWDFSAKVLGHLKNNIVVRYGRDLKNDRNMIQMTQIIKHEGDFERLTHMDIENSFTLKIPFIKLDKSIFFIMNWDFTEIPKVFTDIGIQVAKEKYIKTVANFHTYAPFGEHPLKMALEAKLIFLDYEYLIREEFQEMSKGLFQGRALIQRNPDYQITIDHTYVIRSTNIIFYHEADFTLTVPGRPVPNHQKLSLKYFSNGMEFMSRTDIGSQSPYAFEIKLSKVGISELNFQFPVFEGKLKVNNMERRTTFEVDFKTTARDQRHISGSGTYALSDETDILTLEISWDADRDPGKKLVMNGKSSKENDVRILTADMNYAGSINVAINGRIKEPFLYGPHNIRADFSGNIEPMSLVYTHEISDGHLISVLKYLRNELEKVRADIKGKFICNYSHFELQGGLLVTSPYKAFDGKEVYGHLLLDSNDAARSAILEYRLKPGYHIGYIGKADYKRKRSWPGQVRSTAVVIVNRQQLYEGTASADYGNGKYSFRATINPPSKRKMNFDTTMEYAARYAAFHHLVSLSFQHLQLIRMNAVADFRNMEDYKLQSNFDVNSHKLYDVNGTLSIRSATDFEGKFLVLGKLVPSMHIFTKTQNANSVTKYSLAVERDSVEILSGKGEVKKRKKNSSGEIVFNYRGDDFLTVNVNNEVIKNQREGNSIFKLKFKSRTYTANVHWLKEKKTTKHSITMCRNENDNCFTIITAHKDEEGKHDYEVTYKRAGVEFGLHRITGTSGTSSERSLVFHFGERKIGYNLHYDTGDTKEVSFGLITTSREIKVRGSCRSERGRPHFTLEVQSDVESDRTLKIEMWGDNQLTTDRPSEVHITVTHPIFEKAIELNAVANYDRKKQKVLDVKLSLDYSKEPDDKIIIKIHADKIVERTLKMRMDIYHKDEQHLDFKVKINGSSIDGTTDFGVEYLWKDENNADKNAYMYAKHNAKERRLDFVVHREKIDFNLNAVAAPITALHGDQLEYDVVVSYNEKLTTSKLFYDYDNGCIQLKISSEGEMFRVVELCSDVRKPVMFSLTTKSLEEDIWVFDYSFEIIRKGYMGLNIRNHWNPEFLGGVVFEFSQLTEQLIDANIGHPPFAVSPQYRKMRKSFNTKVIQPLKNLVVEESKKFSNEIITDLKYLKEKSLEYYENMPPKEYYLELLEDVKPLLRRLLYETKEYAEGIRVRIYDLYNDILRQAKEMRNRLRERCAQQKVCNQVMNLILEEDWNELQQLIRRLIARLPPHIREYVERDGKIEVWMRNAYHKAMAYLEPILESSYFEDVKLLMQEACDYAHQMYETYSVQLERLLRRLLLDIRENEHYRKAKQAIKDETGKIMMQIQNMDWESLLNVFEDYLSHLQKYLSYVDLRSFFNVNLMSSERGILDVDIFFPVDLSILRRLMEALYSRIAILMEFPEYYNWKTLIITLKRIAAFNFIPPYKEQAVILGKEHYVTFDKTFYDFAGECTYLLATDLDDGNFSVILSPTFSLNPDQPEEKHPSLGVFAKKTAVMIDLEDKTVKAGAKRIDLPFESRDLTVTREGNTILFDDHYGVQVQCHLNHDVCVVSISGWYYGKTAGLLGTYDYEPANDFRRPKGQIPNSVTTFAKSWDISKGCKTKNLVQDVKIDRHSEIYKSCTDVFEKQTSALSACFSEVEPDQYLSMCYKYLSTQLDKTKALCDVSTAYVMECERNYVEINLPPSCLTCVAPDESIMKHGDRKKFDGHPVNSSDTVFVVEAATCNEHLLKDLNNIARFIDKELMNEGFGNNRYGLVVFDRSGHNPMIHSARGNVLFELNDIRASSANIHLDDTRNNSRAFDALNLAVTYPFRPGTSKTIILIACTPCKYDYNSMQYPVIQQIMLEHDIILHVISDQNIKIKKSKAREIIGADSETVYTSKDGTQKDLVGEPELRSQTSLPKDACVALSQDVDGSFFSAASFIRKDVPKSWRSLFARRVLKTAARISSCQMCDCTATADHVPQVICQPCEIRRPNLPFSVCKSCGFPRELTAFYSYLLHMAM